MKCFKFWICLWMCLSIVGLDNPVLGMGPGDDQIVSCPENSSPPVTSQPLGQGSHQENSGLVTQQPGPCNAPQSSIWDGTDLNVKDPCAKCGQGAACGAMVCGCIGLGLGCAFGLPDPSTLGNWLMAAGTCVGGALGCSKYGQQVGNAQEAACCKMCEDAVCAGMKCGVGVGAGVTACMGGGPPQICMGAVVGGCVGGACGACASCLHCTIKEPELCRECLKTVQAVQTCMGKEFCSREQCTACCGTVPKAVSDTAKTAKACCCGCCPKKKKRVLVRQASPLPSEVNEFLASAGTAETAVFIPGYNHKAQSSSLIALQGMLLGASDQVVSNLKSLVFRAYQGSSEEHLSSQFMDIQPKRRLYALQGLSRNSRGTLQGLKAIKPKASYKIFGFMDNYEANLERKVRSGRVGVSMSLIPGVKGTFAYDTSKQGMRKHNGFSLQESKGSAAIKSATEGFSTAFVMNPDKTGFISHVASSYGWGKVKTHRYVRHGQATIHTKGNPASTLSGGLIQVGYNVPIFEEHQITPYIEHIISTVQWKAYEEKAQMIPCAVSRNKEQVIEQSIGLRHQWTVQQRQHLQTWVAHVAGKRTVSGLTSKPIMSNNPWYEITVPHYKQKYSGTEVGFTYQIAYSELCTVGLNGSMRFQTIKKTDKQNYSLYMQYVF